jgi:hypothetical protein
LLCFIGNSPESEAVVRAIRILVLVLVLSEAVLVVDWAVTAELVDPAPGLRRGS